tara:strand:- start:48 stop:305 length:258 start_codon:yes stop_codon:yes gene_type:complete
MITNEEKKLLEHIEKLGSLNKASRELKIPLALIKSKILKIEHSEKCKVLIKMSGGLGGGGSRLSREGRELIRCFNSTKKSDISKH